MYATLYSLVVRVIQHVLVYATLYSLVVRVIRHTLVYATLYSLVVRVIQHVLVYVVYDRILQEVLDALASLESSPYLGGAHFVADPLRHDVYVALRRGYVAAETLQHIQQITTGSCNNIRSNNR